MGVRIRSDQSVTSGASCRLFKEVQGTGKSFVRVAPGRVPRAALRRPAAAAVSRRLRGPGRVPHPRPAPSGPGCGPWSSPPIGLTAADPFADGEVSGTDSRVHLPGIFTCARCPAVIWPLMPDRRRITIRRQPGGGLCSFRGHPEPGGHRRTGRWSSRSTAAAARSSSHGQKGVAWGRLLRTQAAGDRDPSR